MKKKILIPIVVAVFGVALASCFKEDDTQRCTPNALSQDKHIIDSFLLANGSSLTYNDTYMGYIGTINMGDGSSADADSIVAFKQTIRTFKGDELITVGTDSISRNPNTQQEYRFSDFQNTSPIYYLLTNVQKGGSMRIIYPSSANALGYLGCQQQSLQSGEIIPANSQVIIDFELTGVKNAH